MNKLIRRAWIRWLLITFSLIKNGQLIFVSLLNYEQAEQLYQRALHIREQALGPEHPDVAGPLNGLANLSRERGKYEQAEALYQRALTIRQQSQGSLHPDVAETLQDLALLRQRQHQDTEALSFSQQALAFREQALGAQHPKTCETREFVCALLNALGKTEEAALLEGAQPKQAQTESEHVTAAE